MIYTGLNTFYDYWRVYAFDYNVAMYWWRKSWAYEKAMNFGSGK